MWRAESNAAVKIFVASGSKKPSLGRSWTIGMVTLPARRERDWSLSHRGCPFMVLFPMMRTSSAHLHRLASLVFPVPKHLGDIADLPKLIRHPGIRRRAPSVEGAADPAARHGARP